jgi:hypothetical protein
MQEQVGIGDVVHHRRDDLRERASDKNAIQQAGVFVADRLRGFRPAGTPVAGGH